MEPNPSSRRLLFAFPHPARCEESKISSGEMPRERLYGAMELQERGWQVDYADGRFIGRSAGIHRRLLELGINSLDFSSLARLSHFDCLVVKDGFSTATTIVAKVVKTPILYLDAMFDMPRRWHRNLSARLNLRMADRVACYSRSQAELWAECFDLPVGRFAVLPYCIDTGFYRTQVQQAPVERRVLAVGRDLGRDFDLLGRALRDTDVQLTLVTLPYLVSDALRRQSNVEILERLPYEELFSLYARSACVVVPLRSDVTYPSGIRAVMESLVLGKATVATESAVLREYFGELSGLDYVPAGEEAQLRADVLRLVDDEQLRRRREAEGPLAMECFGLDRFVDCLETLLTEVIAERRG